ncbi:MAG TPA: carboxyltransferase domain-containing protein [Paracoccaceae bacterium]|nr:carboxyltransferase domain-containing protein [Paracoccaceae bacterium]
MPSPQEPHDPHENAGFPAVSPIGVDGLLIAFGGRLTEPANRAALAFRAEVDAAGLTGVVETATAPAAVYVRFDHGQTAHVALQDELGALLSARDWWSAPLPAGRRRWLVPAAFGAEHGPLLDEAATMAGLSPDAAVAALCARPLRVQTIGFAPGQPYLGQLPAEWDLPRLSSLTRVPDGAVTVAIRQVVLFSVASPTGWRHVGQTALRLFRPESGIPSLLRPGDEVQFRPVGARELDALRRDAPDGGAVAEALE